MIVISYGKYYYSFIEKYKIAEIPVSLPKDFCLSKMRLADVFYGFCYTLFIFIKVKLLLV